MKLFFRIIRSICLSIFGIYSVNVLFSMLNIVIPINVYTLSVSSIFGVFGISAVVLARLLIK